ncbi:MAG: VOC family protein [Lentisphaeria bacterium]|nr:VOC family protein [Lentisphaeria bacterium]
MHQHEKINYLEFPAKDLGRTKTFFSKVFGWEFEDYGPEYTVFNHAGLDGGFFLSELCSQTKNGAVLTVLYSTQLEQTQKKITQAGGEIAREIFSFPGGRRFHFTDPNGNEFAVWSDC